MLDSMNEEQVAYLSSLICQRLHAAIENRNLIGFFVNHNNDGLVRDLHLGWKQDQNGETAYYVVKDPQTHMILLYFSLRCGSLHTPDPYQRYQADFKKAEALYDAALGKKDARKWALERIEGYKENGVLPQRIIDKFRKQRDDLKAMLKALKRDHGSDPSQNTVQTLENFSGVEMVHFCKNELAKNIWENSPLKNRPLGETLFWCFILPIIQETSRMVGCKYVYLFAADSSKEQSLVAYYRDCLHFEIREDLCAQKPAYDVCCASMCQELKVLERYQTDFINCFNRPRPPKDENPQE